MSADERLLQLAEAAERIAGLSAPPASNEPPGEAPLLRLERALAALHAERQISERERRESKEALLRAEAALRTKRAKESGPGLERMKSEFISSVSHELLTPLTSIISALSLLLDGTAPLDAEAAELLRLSKRNADRLLRRVSDFLDLSRLDDGTLVLTTSSSSPAQLCAQSASLIDVFAKKRGVELRVDAEQALAPVSADFERILQVLNNLLSNAIKFSPRGGQVVLRAALAAGETRFEVIDQGPGIPQEFRSKIFTRFAQWQRDEREQAGMGVGLALCQALLRRHNGTIGFESVPGNGATFFFTLPLASASTADAK